MPEIQLSKTSRWAVYFLFVFSNILISLDHGSIPAVTSELRKIVYNDQAIGLFGSLVFVGNIIGSSISFYLINKVNRKLLLLLSLFLLSICLITFVLYTNILFMFSNRICVGIFQSYITIYLPVWVNQYGMEDKKSIMMTFTQLVVPLGVFLGYLIASITVENEALGSWKFSFIIQSIGVVLLALVFFLVPKIYFDSELTKLNPTSDNNQREPEDTSIFGLNNQIGPTLINKSSSNSKIIPSNNMNENNTSDTMQMLKSIISVKVYIFSVFGLTTLFYVITGIQYWVSDYMDRILLIESHKSRLLYFTIVCFTSPTIGILIGGYLLSYLGGYEKKESILFALLLTTLAALCAMIIPFTDSIFYFIILLWLTLFFGGGILPTLTGIIVSSLPAELRAPGFSFTTFIGNLCGYLPAPYVYGLLTDILNDKGRIGMFVNLWMSIVGVICIIFASYYRYKTWEEVKKEGEPENELDKEMKEGLLDKEKLGLMDI